MCSSYFLVEWGRGGEDRLDASGGQWLIGYSYSCATGNLLSLCNTVRFTSTSNYVLFLYLKHFDHIRFFFLKHLCDQKISDGNLLMKSFSRCSIFCVGSC